MAKCEPRLFTFGQGDRDHHSHLPILCVSDGEDLRVNGVEEEEGHNSGRHGSNSVVDYGRCGSLLSKSGVSDDDVVGAGEAKDWDVPANDGIRPAQSCCRLIHGLGNNSSYPQATSALVLTSKFCPCKMET